MVFAHPINNVVNLDHIEGLRMVIKGHLGPFSMQNFVSFPLIPLNLIWDQKQRSHKQKTKKWGIQ